MARAKPKRVKAAKVGKIVIPRPPAGSIPAPRRKTKRATTRTCNGKCRYRDEQEAISALHHLQNYSTRDKKVSRVYECPYCAGWHLASGPHRPGPSRGRVPRAGGLDGEATSPARIRELAAELRAAGLGQRARALEALLSGGTLAA